jgi:SAM-dependent methyltransferase
MSYLDVGCGQGKLISLLGGEFARVAGCDISEGMISHASGLEVRLQQDPCSIPFKAAEFDVVSAVCVYHHVPETDWMALTCGIARVLKPGGTFAVIEHNPFNPVTKLIVSRSPVDRTARLLSPQLTRTLLFQAGLIAKSTSYFWFFPERAYQKGGAAVERWLAKVPLGGQYAVFAQKVGER